MKSRPERPSRRLLHTSDVHVGCDSNGLRGGTDRGYESLAGVVDLGRDLQVDLLIIAGDLFDNLRVRPDMVGQVGELLAAGGLRTIILPGNHDPHMNGSIYDRHGALFPDHVHILRDSDGEVLVFPDIDLQIWGKAHASFDDHAPLHPPPRWHDHDHPERRLWRVAVGHGLYYEGVGDDHRSYLIHDDHLAAIDADYVALGHIEVHRAVGPNEVVAFYPGAPDRTGGATLIELSDAAVNVEHVKFRIPVRA
ncbi:MAG: exonuclease SbcCD subunit D [Gammaproteobacteria bacterium]